MDYLRLCNYINWLLWTISRKRLPVLDIWSGRLRDLTVFLQLLSYHLRGVCRERKRIHTNTLSGSLADNRTKQVKFINFFNEMFRIVDLTVVAFWQFYAHIQAREQIYQHVQIQIHKKKKWNTKHVHRETNARIFAGSHFLPLRLLWTNILWRNGK